MWQLVATAVSSVSITDWLLFAFGLLLILYIVGTWNYDYFQKRGIPSSKPKIPFMGDMANSFLTFRSMIEHIRDQYKMGDGHGLYGFFEFTIPALMIRDPEILKLITVKEFDKFMNHRNLPIELMEPLFKKNLANLRDQPWRNMRTTLRPAFTSSKIKAMVPLISECGHQMVLCLRHKYETREEGNLEKYLTVDMKNLFSRMANDVIASVAFGVGCDSHNQPENEFYRTGKTLTSFTKLKVFIFFGTIAFPKLIKFLGLRVIDKEATEFFTSLVNETIREREMKDIYRPDMLQLLMQARDGKLKTEEDEAETEEVGDNKYKLTDEDIAAQVIIFFFAGFETVSTALSLSAHSLAHHPEVQKRLHEEIGEVMEKTGGKLTHESVQGMTYLDAVINEVLRLYPPNVVTDRVCQEDYQLPATDGCVPITVKKEQLVNIPIVGLHYDPKYWNNPEEFNPNRFSDENKHKIRPFTYLPFGVGPRICIAQRFALIEVKIALVHLLSSFELLPSSKTKHPIVFASGFNVVPAGGFWCELKLRGV